MKIGRLDPKGSLTHDGFVLAYQTTFDTTTTTTTFSGYFNGDTDEEWIIDFFHVNGYPGAVDTFLELNGDATALNYKYQHLTSVTTVVSSASVTASTGVIMSTAASLGQIARAKIHIHTKSGFVRTAITERADQIASTTTTVTSVKLHSWGWINTATNITSLKITASQNGGVGIGSVLSIWKKARRV